MGNYQITLKDGEETLTFDLTSEEIKLLKDFFKRYDSRPTQRKSKLKNLQSYI
jgi:hypothetical protein